jgi:hypothetical protein
VVGVRALVGLVALVWATLVPSVLAGPAFSETLGAYDERMSIVVSLLDTAPSTVPLHGVLDANHVTIDFVSMAPGIYARYSVARHVIEIDDRWADADQVTLAAVIAHEATHAADAVSGYLATGGAPACIDSEVRAFRASALFWLSVYGPLGKPVAENDLERQLNSIAERQQKDPAGLEQLVRQTYSQQCSH